MNTIEENQVKEMLNVYLERIAELEAQIDSMKNCINCKQVCRFDEEDKVIECWSNNYSHWQPKEAGK